jgi:type I restriction-modification system DNA methylase subunit
MEKLKSFSQYMQQLAVRNSISKVFTDFLEMSVCALSLGAMETRYLEIVGRYEKHEVNLLADAFAAMVLEMDNNGEGLRDILGDFFMEHISHGHNGQFFTPEPICEMMARMTNPIESDSRILDCACGSGRILIAAAKVNRNASFYGADIDRTCCMMCLINFCLNGLLGEVAWMDSLSNQFFGAWQIRLHPGGGIPYIVPITEAESLIVLKLPEQKANQIKTPIPEFEDVLAELIEAVPVKAQQLLFNF